MAIKNFFFSAWVLKKYFTTKNTYLNKLPVTHAKYFFLKEIFLIHRKDEDYYEWKNCLANICGKFISLKSWSLSRSQKKNLLKIKVRQLHERLIFIFFSIVCTKKILLLSANCYHSLLHHTISTHTHTHTNMCVRNES